MSAVNALEEEVAKKNVFKMAETISREISPWSGRKLLLTYVENSQLSMGLESFDPFRCSEDLLSRCEVDNEWRRVVSGALVAVVGAMFTSLIWSFQMFLSNNLLAATFFLGISAACFTIFFVLLVICFFCLIKLVKEVHFDCCKVSKKFFHDLGIVLVLSPENIDVLVDHYDYDSINEFVESNLVRLAGEVYRLEREVISLDLDLSEEAYSRESIDRIKDKEESARDEFREYHRLARKFGLAKRSEFYFVQAKAILEKREAEVNI